MSSNLSTAITIAANMIGSVTIVAPTLFLKQGFLGSFIVMCFMGAVYCKTCQLWSKHQRRDQNDISEIVLRVLGKKWYFVLGISSGLFLLLLCVIYFLLLNKILYPVIIYTLQHGFKIKNFEPTTQGIVFNKFSIQYLGIINIVLFLPFFLLKSIDRVLKLARFGIVFLIIYFFTLIATFAFSVIKHGFHFNQVKLFSNNIDGFIDVAGQFSLAFISHNTIVAVTKSNKSMKQIPKAISYGYLIAGILYAMFGVFGGLAILNQNYTKQAPFSIIIGITLSLYIVSIFGIFPYVSRMQFYCFSDYKKLSNIQFYGYNFLIMASCLIFQIFNTSPGIVIALTGTGVGFFVCFVLPIYIHFKCYYPGWKQLPQTEQVNIANTLSSIGNQQKYEDLLSKDIQINKKKQSIMTENDSIVSEYKDTSCLDHEQETIKKYGFNNRVIFYILIMFVGMGNFIMQIKLIFD